MDIGYGFHTGVNHVMKSRILFWRRKEEGDFTWIAYLWKISYYFTLTGYDDFSVDVILRSWEDRRRLYSLSVKYDEEIDGDNYRISRDSQLWESHHRRAVENREVLIRLLNEPVEDNSTICGRREA